MKVILDRKHDSPQNVRNIIIEMNADKHFTISVDPNRGIVINKTNHEGEGELIITPHVSNEISIK